MDEPRVLIMADDPLARGGLAALLADHCTLVGQVAPDSETLAVYSPNILLWDLGWEMSGVPDSLDEFVELGVPVVVLLPDDGFAAQIWAAGAQGLLLRDSTLEHVLAALNAVSHGLVVLDPALARSSMLARPITSDSDLTSRELEVLQLLAEGAANRAIAQRLDISEHTVKFHVNAIMSKLDAQSRTEAVVQGIKSGLITV
jgi:DNA-binding NarL/FixJ family response regulator